MVIKLEELEKGKAYDLRIMRLGNAKDPSAVFDGEIGSGEGKTVFYSWEDGKQEIPFNIVATLIDLDTANLKEEPERPSYLRTTQEPLKEIQYVDGDRQILSPNIRDIKMMIAYRTAHSVLSGDNQ